MATVGKSVAAFLANLDTIERFAFVWLPQLARADWAGFLLRKIGSNEIIDHENTGLSLIIASVTFY